MKKTFLSPLEIAVLLLFVLGLTTNYFFTHYPPLFIILVYIIGISFEYMTRSLWIYAKSVQHSIFTVKGVNLILGFGWVGSMLIGLAFSNYIQSLLHFNYFFIAMVIGIGIIGNLIEQLYYVIGLFSYDMKKKILWFFGCPTVVLDIPLSVRVGYFYTQPITMYILLKLTAFLTPFMPYWLV
ncbi:hypothetical protein [Candidatus Albibeggiatoa sp. nov. BB20]|uniref:hypothetical protein n=1 Tax=Candidatus Albibeggiatoa sp. nov. BB20 TaxID=3162723 RepID=UPI003365603C